MTAIYPAYQSTLDALVQITVAKSKAIYQLQLIVLCLEGGLLCMIACAYMAYVAEKFSAWRYKLYEVFISIPLGVTRGLANMSLKLEANDETDEDEHGLHIHHVLSADHGGLHHLHALHAEEEEQNAAAANANTNGANNGHVGSPNGGGHHGGGGHADHGADKRSSSHRRRGSTLMFADGLTGGAADEGSGGAGSMVRANAASHEGPRASRLFSFAAFTSMTGWRNRAKVAPAKHKTKRSLLPSQRLAMSLLAPFVVWGLIIIVINVVGYTGLKAMTAPIATLNVVNAVLIRIHRVVYYVLESAAAANLESRAYFKSTLAAELRDLVNEYSVMLYGNQAAPSNSEQTHFILAKTGVVFGNFDGPSALLFDTHECLCANQSECQPASSELYEVSRNGLNVLMQSTFKAVEALVVQPLETSDMNSTEFRTVWELGGTDVDGGMSLMSSLFQDQVHGAYQGVVIQQIVMFCVAWAWGLGFLVMQLRPLMRRTRSEMRRIAELLSQLPGEVDCEHLVMAVILGEQGAPVPHPHITASLFGKKVPLGAGGGAVGGAASGGGGGGAGGGGSAFGGFGNATMKAMGGGGGGGGTAFGGGGAMTMKIPRQSVDESGGGGGFGRPGRQSFDYKSVA
ncbi:hypothetical protein GPECTOR_85g344 [Gonium pectorale]|uniref:Uncharacterized protein n=1 Tax=Gonium pectorale TaxID=33097 RepID=A0A150G1B4_GONPE|nr:hypothetical protein GPECTOR_85g344 [Gonium pectorale]|eukprot:KXZ43614.1 hypothetical protein GPECTOR_85g344 [Gonium pectorale]